VARLKSTWEKLPGKYSRLFTEMQQLMDPSRNMSRYRNLVNAENVQPPIIPFYPIVKKDLTFIHLGNHSEVENMINFEKLRMIAKEVRPQLLRARKCLQFKSAFVSITRQCAPDRLLSASSRGNRRFRASHFPQGTMGRPGQAPLLPIVPAPLSPGSGGWELGAAGQW
jgi:hypothetical protein